MNVDKPAVFLKDISIIVGIVIGGWFALEAIFVTQTMMARHTVVEVEREIDTGEKVRDHYQNMEDHGKELSVYEARRLRITSDKLDRLYDELEQANLVLDNARKK